MNTDVANILLGYFSDLPFMDKYAGLVRPVVKVDVMDNGSRIRKVFPVGCNVTEQECTPTKLGELVPNSRYKSVHYIEEIQGARLIGRDGARYQFESVLRIVGWMNLKAVGHQGECSVSSLAILNIIDRLPDYRFNNGIYINVQFSIVGEAIKDASIFNRYTYDEATTQYLMHPFDFYALDVRVRFSIHPNCIEQFELLPIVC